MKTKIILLFLTLLTCSFAQNYDGRNVLGAELYSSELFRFGRFEVRMRMAATSGSVSSMFLYHNDSYLGAPEPWREIDMEVLGKSPLSFQSNIITGAAGKQTTSEQHHALDFSTQESYNTYAIEWTPTGVAWFINGTEVRRTAGTQQTNDLQDTDQGLRFNLWSSTSVPWAGAFDTGTLPIHQFINWVKVYDYTPGAGENGSDFTLRWADEFDSFETARWNKGNWTFDGNSAYLTPQNINVQNGTLIISLTTTENPGFSGTVPEDNAPSSIRPPFRKPVKRSSEKASHFDLLGRSVK
ncbi:MAG: family 16 glycosylhydrolase [Fibrobacter sp.]|jgi:hypothetical protein|nr:family 16 glycosylhydrolase [Fibrobacter sp.]